jgi:hypothetical protein
MKICKKCNIEKEYNLFYKDKGKKDGCRTTCIECDRIYNENNKEKRSEYTKKYDENNKEKRSEYLKNYREKNKEVILEKRKDSYNKNKEKELKNCKIYYETNKEVILENSRNNYHNLENKKEFNKRKNDKRKDKRKEDYEKNKEDILVQRKTYYIENKEIINTQREVYKPKRNEKRREKYKYKINNDILFICKESIRSLIKQSFKRKGCKKESNTVEILGISYSDFKEYLESKFEDWMTWENKGLYNGDINYGWDIDHIIPISNAKNEEEVIKLNHYTNLQPLCGYINRVIKRNL